MSWSEGSGLIGEWLCHLETRVNFNALAAGASGSHR